MDAEPTAGVADIASIADDPSLLEHAYRIALDSEPDIPDVRPWVEPSSFEEWRAREIDDALFVPEASLVVLVDGEPAAYGLVQLDREGVGEHLATGVARAYRGRGLASSLKRAQIQAARCAGLHELVAHNDEANAPIRRVNATLGYRIAREIVTYRGPLV